MVANFIWCRLLSLQVCNDPLLIDELHFGVDMGHLIVSQALIDMCLQISSANYTCVLASNPTYKDGVLIHMEIL